MAFFLAVANRKGGVGFVPGQSLEPVEATAGIHRPHFLNVFKDGGAVGEKFERR